MTIAVYRALTPSAGLLITLSRAGGKNGCLSDLFKIISTVKYILYKRKSSIIRLNVIALFNLLSNIFAIWCYMKRDPAAHEHWSSNSKGSGETQIMTVF